MHVRVHSRCCPFCGFGQIYNDMYSPLSCHTERFTAIKVLCVLSIHHFKGKELSCYLVLTVEEQELCLPDPCPGCTCRPAICSFRAPSVKRCLTQGHRFPGPEVQELLAEGCEHPAHLRTAVTSCSAPALPVGMAEHLS